MSPGGSGYFTCIQNMKLVPNKFKSGGLHEKDYAFIPRHIPEKRNNEVEILQNELGIHSENRSHHT